MKDNELLENIKQMTNDIKTIKNVLLFCLVASALGGILIIYVSTNPSALSF